MGYFNGDYQPIDLAGKWNTTTDRFAADITGSNLAASRHNLYNGNIGHMVTTIRPAYMYSQDNLDTPLAAAQPLGTAYNHDQLNRLKEAKSFTNIDLVDNEWESGASYTGMYYNSFDYDANGNILRQLRKDHSGAVIDSLTYRYARNAAGKMVQNRHYHINDTVNASTFGNDLDDMGTFTSSLNSINTHNNYSFDGIGQLIKDSLQEVEEIRWYANGKVKEIIRYNGSSKKNMKFDYDAMGRRIAKHIYNNSNDWEKSTYYVLDGHGNVMSIYEHKVDGQTISFTQTEKNIYGIKRVGMDVTNTELISALLRDDTLIQHVVGNKNYELSNHLGNVLAVITDKKIPIEDGQNAGEVDYFEPELIASTDFSPFGVRLSNRNWNSSSYRYSFQNQEHDDEISGEGRSINFEYRMYSPDEGKFKSLDPLFFQFPWNSPYAFSENKVINSIELEGLESVLAINFGGDVQARVNKFATKVSSKDVIVQSIELFNEQHSLIQGFIDASNADPAGIGFAIFFGHGTPNQMYGDHTSNGGQNFVGRAAIFMHDLEELERAVSSGQIHFSDDAVIFINNCNAGTCKSDNDPSLYPYDYDISYAQKLADVTGAKVIAVSTTNKTNSARSYNGTVSPVFDGVEPNDMKFQVGVYRTDEFKLFQRGKQSIDLGNTINIRPWMIHATSNVQKVELKKASQIETPKPATVTMQKVVVPE